MPNALQQAGAAAEPSNFAPLNTDRIFTGLWSNRNPLRDAATSSNEEKYYGARQDSILGGYNSEISSKLTLRRRPGNSVYNANTFTPIISFYSFNTFTLTSEAIRVLADTATDVWDVTNGVKNSVWHKAAGAQRTYFLGVGNNLYFTNGVENKQWNVPGKAWAASTPFYMGDTILDPAGHVQKVVGFLPMAISTIAVAAMTGGGRQANITLTAATTYLGGPAQIVASSIPSLNHIPFNAVESGSTLFYWFSVPGGVSTFPATSTGGYLASTSSNGGNSGATAPAWQTTLNGVTIDGQILWQMIGPSVVNWGIAAPINAPTITQSTRPNPYASWAPNTIFGTQVGSVSQIVLKDSNNNMQRLVPANGNSGATAPAWNATVFGTTPDNQLTWQNQGPAAWVASHAYLIGVPISVSIAIGTGTQNMTFICTAQGTSAAAAPQFWPQTIGSSVQDGGVTWVNIGITLTWTASTYYSITYQILDPNGYIQTILQPGKTGAGVPTFQTGLSNQTVDNLATWINTGNFSAAATAAVQYGYAYGNTVTSDISGMSPASAAVMINEGNQVVVQGIGSSDPQVNIIYLYRTEQGGSDFLLLGTIPNPGAVTWSFTDTTSDADLNAEIQAQISGEGTVLPRGATALEYHLGRIFAAVGNVVWVSSGPDAVASGSSGNAGFDTFFTCQSKITRFWVNSLGIAVFTVRDCYLILGDGATTALYMIRWIENVPLLSYDCLSIFLTTAYLLTGKKMVLAFDPSAGVVEVSQPIADLINTYNPATSYLTFHSQESGETALYAADGTQGWYRFAPTSAPESGSNWSAQAKIAGGTSAVQSVEISPGVYNLLIGPPAAGGPILKRDLTVNTDDGIPFPVSTRFGSVVVAQPGELAALAWMTLEAQPSGTAPALSVLLSEINGEFESVPRTRQDPPNLPPSQSLYSNRHSLMQNQMPTWCRHFQFEIDWPAEDAANELLSFTIFGQLWQEMRSQ